VIPKPAGRIFAVGDDEVDGLIADDAGQTVFYDGAAGASENVADEENSHGKTEFDGNTRRLRRDLAKGYYSCLERSLRCAESRSLPAGFNCRLCTRLLWTRNIVEIPEIDVGGVRWRV